MRIIRDTDYMTPRDQGAVVAIGNFDGVHLGHLAVIEAARDQAKRLEAPLGVMTFEPHPREVFQPNATPFRLMNAETKANRLDRLGVERLYELPFTSALLSLSPQEFAQEILVNRLGLKHVVVGEDFFFGARRAGNADVLTELGAQLGFGVTIVPLITIGDEEASSTAIRDALAAGQPEDAADMLGHLHRIDGEVIQGDQRGRELGFPTANMSIAGLHPPKFGVYAVRVDVLDGPHKGSYIGASSIGVRPMFGENLPNCETYLFDFKGDLYGATLSVALVQYLRPELKFDSLDALIEQMDADCAQAREILTNG